MHFPQKSCSRVRASRRRPSPTTLSLAPSRPATLAPEPSLASEEDVVDEPRLPDLEGDRREGVAAAAAAVEGRQRPPPWPSVVEATDTYSSFIERLAVDDGGGGGAERGGRRLAAGAARGERPEGGVGGGRRRVLGRCEVDARLDIARPSASRTLGPTTREVSKLRSSMSRWITTHLSPSFCPR